MLSRKAKAAIKTGLAYALIYGIALKFDWVNPYWASMAVAMISLQTAGESIHKGLDRMAGTIPGCIAAITILALAAQSRWEFLLLTSVWIFFTVYMSLRSRNNVYFWNVAGFVCLALISTSATTSQEAFEFIAFRMLDTLMGISVYTLVTVFIWPHTNAGQIKKLSRGLMATQSAICRVGRESMTGMDAMQAIGEKPAELHQQELEQLDQLAQALVAEGSESYEVHELRSLWDRFHGLSMALMESLDRWHSSMAELARMDVNRALPAVPALFDELDCRFEEIQRLLAGESAGHEPSLVKLSVDRTALRNLSHFERAALAVTRTELEAIESLTAALLDCALDLAGEARESSTRHSRSMPAMVSPGIKLPIVDLDNLRFATYVSAVLCIGFLVWIYVDPPGHKGWYQLLTTMSLLTVATPQVPATRLAKPLAVAAVLSACIYTFIMPHLSSYYGLGLLLFSAMFILRYFFTGIAQKMGSVAFVNVIPIQNQQTYDFAMEANTVVYMSIVLLLLFMLSYLIGSPRPEKHVLTLVRRFFRSTEFLMSSVTRESNGKASVLGQWKLGFYLHEMKSLPGKIGVWSKAIDQNKFPGNKPDQVQNLVTNLYGLMYRIEYLLEARETRQAELLARELGESLRTWRESIESHFVKWSDNPGSASSIDLEQGLAAGLSLLEQSIDATIEQKDRETFSEEDGENFYRLLGAYRGVSEAAVAYAGNATAIDWAEWSEEKF